MKDIRKSKLYENIEGFYENIVTQLTTHLHLSKEYELIPRYHQKKILIYITKFDDNARDEFYRLSKETRMENMDDFFKRNEEVLMHILMSEKLSICEFVFPHGTSKLIVGKGNKDKNRVRRKFDLADPECFQKIEKWLGEKTKGWDPKRYIDKR